jgi:hypothetical protein
MGRFTYYAASYGYSQCDAMGTYVALRPDLALAAAEEAAREEEERSRDCCDQEDCDDEDCIWCHPRLWVNGEHAFAAGSLFSARELREVRWELLGGQVVVLDRG